MITYQELNAQNHRVTELSNVILHLIRDRSLCDTRTTCDLFFRYVEEVRQHLEIQDKHIFSRLLSESSPRARSVVQNFMSGAKEVRRIFNAYLNKWCHPQRHELVVRNHDEFVKETEGMFQLVLQRIQDETEHLYPLIREMTGDMQNAA